MQNEMPVNATFNVLRAWEMKRDVDQGDGWNELRCHIAKNKKIKKNFSAGEQRNEKREREKKESDRFVAHSSVPFRRFPFLEMSFYNMHQFQYDTFYAHRATPLIFGIHLFHSPHRIVTEGQRPSYEMKKLFGPFEIESRLYWEFLRLNGHFYLPHSHNSNFGMNISGISVAPHQIENDMDILLPQLRQRTITRAKDQPLNSQPKYSKLKRQRAKRERTLKCKENWLRFCSMNKLKHFMTNNYQF